MIDLISEIKLHLLDGYRVNFGDLCSIYPKIKANFQTVDDAFDSSIHTISVGASPSSELRNYMQENVTPEKIEAPVNVPNIISVTDAASASIDTNVTAGHIVTLNGHRLSFDNLQADEGVFMVDSVDNTETVAMTEYAKATAGTVVFNAASTPLTSAEGYLELRSRMGKPAGEVIVNRFATKLTQL